MAFRYLVIKITIPNIMEKQTAKFSDNLISKAIIRKIEEYFDVPTRRKVEESFICKYFNDQSKMAIIRIDENYQQVIKDVLPLITILNNINMKCLFLYNGGTVERCRRFITNYQRRLLRNAKQGNLIINDSIGILLNSGL